MLLDLKRIFAVEGAELSFDYKIDMSSYESAAGEFPLKEPVAVKGTIKNTAGVVELRAGARLIYETVCDRCCSPVSEKISIPVYHVLATSVQSEDSEEIFVVENEELDLDDLAMSDIILNLPMKHLCSEGCKGLCPACGKNLNEGPCGCVGQNIDPRLESLKDLLR